jgi:exodeoxyribonuclease (lambda-induced)
MKQHFVEQGHVGWFKLRVGKVTASELGNLLTPEFEIRKGETPKTFVYTKVAESWQGRPLISTGSWQTEQGQIREDEAIPWLALEKEWNILPGGFIETDDGRAGCSPDGLVQGEEFGIEVKCPEAVNHVRYLSEGVLPKAYVAQVYGSMFVTGFKKWVFVSYRRGFPALVLEIYRDQKAMDAIARAIDSFHSEFQRAMTRISNIEKLRTEAA